MAKVRLAVFNPILPGPFRGAQLRNEMRNLLRRTEAKTKRLFAQTTAFWATQVDFDSKSSMAGGVLYFEVSTDNSLYYLLDLGAKRHVIDAGRYPTLVFQSGYTAKTFPGVLASGPSTHTGDYRRPKSVNHPGFEGRDFEGTVAREVEDPFYREAQQIMDDFAKESGHDMPRGRQR